MNLRYVLYVIYIYEYNILHICMNLCAHMAYMYLHVVVNSCMWRSEVKVVVASIVLCFVCVQGHVCATGHVWRSQDDFWKLVLAFYLI